MTRDLTDPNTGSICDGCKFYPSCRDCVLLTLPLHGKAVLLPCQPGSAEYPEYEQQYHYATSGAAK
jgi:hypothetical protein